MSCAAAIWGYSRRKRQQRPPAMHAAMPVEAAEEDRVEHARRQRIAVACQDMVELVRIFLRHMAKRDAGESCGEILVEHHRNATA